MVVVTRRGPRRALAAVLAAGALVTAGCGGYSDGSMARENVPHTHGPAPSASTGAAGMTGMPGMATGPHVHQIVGDGTEPALAGYALDQLTLTPVAGGRHADLSFRVRSPTGGPQLQYTMTHGKLLHLYVVSQDLSSVQHVHPRLDSSGTWTVRLPTVPAGSTRVAVEMVARADDSTETALMLGSDLDVAGTPTSAPLPAPARTARDRDVTVHLAGGLGASRPGVVRLRFTDRRGRPATLAPYLESWTHVAVVDTRTRALRHVHPREVWTEGAAQPSRLTVDVPKLGRDPQLVVVEFATPRGHRQAALLVQPR